MFPTTGRGFTKSRVEGLRQAAHSRRRRRAARPSTPCSGSRTSSRAFATSRGADEPRVPKRARRVRPDVGKEMLVPWLQRAAQQRTQSPARSRDRQVLARSPEPDRLQILTANVVVALEQLTHMPGAAVKVPARQARRRALALHRSPHEVSEAIHEKSEYMRTRETAASWRSRRRSTTCCSILRSIRRCATSRASTATSCRARSSMCRTR
jgi:hypothetical protein